MDCKNKIKTIFSFILKFIAAGATALVVLTIVAIIYNYEGVHVKNPNGSTDYKWESGQPKIQMTEGFSFLKMDVNGFNNSYELTESPDILAMGSSHMEAIELMQSENVSYLLNDSLKDYSVYNIGISGHTIYRCADNFENAVNEYKPRKYVVIETDRVLLDIASMRAVIDGTAERIPSYDSGLMYYLQKIPAVKLLYSQIDKWFSTSSAVSFRKPYYVKKNGNLSKTEETFISEDYKEALSEFLEVISSCASENGIRVIIFYHPGESLDKDGNVAYSTDGAYLDAFENECINQKITFVDMTPEFEKLYSEKHIMAHGFSNTAVGVGHMNKYAHKAIAEKLCAVIKDTEGID